MDSFTDVVANNYLKSPDPFIMGDGNPDQRVHGFHSAVLVARLQKTLSARVGPGASYFRSKEWTPVPTDYSLTSTQYTLPLVSAKFLKLEFTNLVPRVYLTEEEELVVTDYPAWVRDWYRAGIHQSKGGLGYNATTSRNYFEGQTGVRTPGDRKKNPQLRGVLEGRGSGLPPIIYHGDRATVDLAVNPDGFDGSNLYHEQEFATQPMRFYRQSRHDYEVRFVQAERHAFFVGLKELQVFRSDHSVLLDTPEYAETYDDDQYIESTDFINTGGSMTADLAGDQMVSVSFPSFSKFSTIQMAVLDSGWESMMSQAQIDLGTITHLTDPSDVVLSSSTTTAYEVVTGQYLGARGGNVIQISRLAGSTSAAYGVKTASGIFDGTGPITGDNPRTSAIARIQLPDTNLGRYELRLYADNTTTPGRRVVASRPINIPIRTWKEIELAYVAVTDDIDWEAEVVQLDSSVTEPIIVDMLGIWQNSIRWDVANEDSEVQSIALTRQAELYGVSFPGLTYEPPNEVQTVTLVDGPTGGIWTLTYGAETTVDLAFDAAAATVEAALQSLTGLSGVTVTRSGSGTQVDPYVYEVTFLGSLAGKNANQLVSNGVRLTSVGLDVMDDPSNPSFADGTTNTYQDQLLPGALGSGGSDIMPTTEDGGYQEESLPAAPDNSFGDGWDFGSDEEYTVTNLVPLKYPDGFDDEVVTSLSAVDLPPHETEMTYGSLLPAPNVVVVTTQEGGIDALGWPGIDDDQYMVRQGKSNATFRLTFDGNETIDLSIGASATTVRKALEALPSFAPGDIEVNGPDRTDGHYEVTFAGNYAQVDVDPLSVTSAVGCSGVVTVKLPTGGNWQPVLWPMNKPNGYFRFPTARNVVKVRATAMRAGAVVSGWTIVPWYIESSMVMRSPIDYNPPWGVSDDQDLRDTTHKPMFMLWNHYFPQRYSVNLIGLPVPSTL